MAHRRLVAAANVRGDEIESGVMKAEERSDCLARTEFADTEGTKACMFRNGRGTENKMIWLWTYDMGELFTLNQSRIKSGTRSDMEDREEKGVGPELASADNVGTFTN